MLIQGGTMRSGRFRTLSVVGLYWISSNSRLRWTTPPGVVARFRPSSKSLRRRLPDLQVAVPCLDVLGEHVHAANQIVGVGADRFAKQFGIGQDEVRRRNRVGDLADIKRGLQPGVRIDVLGVLDHIGGPAAGDEIELLDEIENLVARPVGIDEALVARIGLDRRRRGLAHHPLQRTRPKVSCNRTKAAVRPRSSAPDRKPSTRPPSRGS